MKIRAENSFWGQSSGIRVKGLGFNSWAEFCFSPIGFRVSMTLYLYFFQTEALETLRMYWDYEARVGVLIVGCNGDVLGHLWLLLS